MKSSMLSVIAASLLLAVTPALAAPPAHDTGDHHKPKHAGTVQTTTVHKTTVHNTKIITHGPSGRNVIVNKRYVGPRDRHTNVQINVVREHRRRQPPNFVFRNYRHHRNFTFDVRTYRRNWYAPQRYHWGYYRRPPHWYRRHWVYGDYIPQAWFARDYWISNFLIFGLLAPPEGCVWVRVGDDALLIDEDTGEVIQVVYNVFY